MRFKAVIFDMDGLLLDTERGAKIAGEKACAQMGLDLPPDFFVDQLVGRDYVTGVKALRATFGDDLDIARLNALWIKASAVQFADGIPLRPGVIDVLDMVDALPLPKAIATSTQTNRAWDKLTGAGLDHRFDILVGCDAVAHPKPAPDPYLEAARRLGQAPADCLAFEDSETGVRAALAAGMTVVQVPDLKPATPGLAHFVADDLITGAQTAGLTP